MFKLTVQGTADVKRAFARATPACRQLLEAAFARSAQSIKASAQARCPVITGALRDSIAIAGKEVSWRVGVSGRRGRSGVPATYGPVVEYGDSYRTAHPFMRPAAQGEEGAIGGRIDEVARKLPAEVAA